MKAETEQLLGYIERNIERTLADCTTCGKCFEACPMTGYSDKLTNQTGSNVVAGIRGILEGSGGTPEALEWTRRHPIVSWVVSDRAAVDACLRFADDHRVLVEPACGAALAAGYGRARPLEGREPVVIVVCGGAGVNRELLDQWDRQVSA